MRRLLAAFPAAWLILLATGCGSSNSGVSGPVTTSMRLQGKVHGGTQPVVGASIQLFSAGTSGYGTGALSLLQSPVITDSQGSFSLTGNYTCPTQNSQLYLTATGGNPGLAAGTTNPALKLMAALGPCSLYNGQYTLNPSLFINLNEVTTVAAAYALSGFFAPDASQLGTSTGNSIGLANAFNTAANLADIPSGTALAQTPGNTGTVPQTRLDALANILSACVNSDGTGSPCSTLFAAATPSGGMAPANTLQAAVSIAQHPTNNVATLFNVASATPPFQPTLTQAPNDWSITLTFTTGALQNGAALDAGGNLWIAAQDSPATNPVDSLIELNNQGQLISGLPGYTGGGLSTPYGVAVDPTGDIWTSNLATLSKFSPSGTALSPTNGYQGAGQSLAIDGFGDVWVPSGSHLVKFDGNGNRLAFYSGGGLATSRGISIDGSENIWIANISGNTNGSVSEFSNAGAPLSPSTGFSTNSTYYAAWVANDSYGDAWAVAQNSYAPLNAVTKIAANGTILSGTSGYQNSTVSFPYQVAVDGNDHVWTMSPVPTGGSLLIELDNSGNFLTGTTGLTLPAAMIPVALAIDSSGNIWLPAQSNLVEETVGAAAPTVTPLSVAVKNNTLGARP